MISEFFMPKHRNEFYVDQDVRNSFDKNGFILVRGLLSSAELAHLLNCVENSEGIKEHSYGVDDGQGHRSRMCLWNYAGDDVTGVVVRSQKAAGTFQALLGGDEIYHYHSKLMMKDPKVGGSFVWHQDYGYWHQNGCLTPDMGTVFVALDRCIKENGCLQVIAGSHRMGLIDHEVFGEQAGVGADKIEVIKQRFQHVYCEMEPGDALFFHSNVLHCSATNTSDLRRWAMAIAYNKRANNPTKEHHHPLYHPLNIVENSEILACTKFDSSTDRGFLDPKVDHSASSLKN